MKKNIITLTLGLMTVIGAGAQERRNWNFTHGWSDETLAYIEQNITAGGDWTLESPGNYQIGDREAGPLTVNIDGTAWEIPETQGLQFGATDAKHIIVAYDNQNGYHGKQFLWINGSKDQDYFTIPKVAGGDKIFIVYESHKTTEERGVECTTEGIYVDGATDQTVSKTLAIDTVVYSVPEAYGSAGVDVTFKATGGYHLYRVCVGQELYDDEPVVEKDKVAYIYDSGFEGYDKAADMPLDLITYELPNRIENMELVEIDAAQADGSVTKDSLMAFEAVVVSGAMRKDNSMAQTMKEAVAYVPMVNLSPELYETWGYAMAVQTGMNTLYVDTTAAKSTLFEPSSASTRPYVDEDGNFSMFISGDGAAGYEAPQGSYFANDSVLAWAGSTPVIHVHNMERNAYIMVPYTYPMGEPDESFIDILPNAIKMVMQTKKAVVKTAKPTVTTTLKKLATEVKFDCSTPNTTYRYTTDGSDPATNGTAYTGPFLVTEAGTIVKVVAQGDGYLPSDVVSSDPVEVKDQVATPVISVAQETGKSTVTIECATPGTEIYYNFSGVADQVSAELYLEPIAITEHSTVYAFAIDATGELIQSETAQEAMLISGKEVRKDILSHFDANEQEWNPNAGSSRGYFYYTEGYRYFTDEVIGQETGKTPDGQRDTVYNVYATVDSVLTHNTGNGWEARTEGQGIVWERTPSGHIIADGSTYNPATVADDHCENTNCCVSFDAVKQTADGRNEPYTASIQSTVRFKGPFDVITYISNKENSGKAAAELYVATDTLQADSWQKVGDLQMGDIKRIWKRTLLSYEGTDEVFVKVASAGGMAAVFDIYVKNHGELSEEYEDMVSGISNAQPDGEIVRTEIYSLSGTRLPAMKRGINIVKEVYANGTVKARKVVVR